MMNWILAFTFLLTFSSQTLAQNGYSYHQPVKPFTEGTTKYPSPTQPERPGIGITSNKYPDSQQDSGERPGSQQPGGSQGPRGYPELPGLSTPQNSGGYFGSQRPSGSGGYPGTHGIPTPQGSKTQQQSSPGTGSFTSSRPTGPGGIDSQGPSAAQGFGGQAGGSQQAGGPQRPSGYPDVQRPSSPQGPTGYSGIQRPTGSAAGNFNGYPSGRSEPTFSQPPGSPLRPQGHGEPQRPERPNGVQETSGPQTLSGSQIPSGPQGSQGSTGYSTQPSTGYPSGRPQGPSFPSAQRPGISEIHETHGSFPNLGFPSPLQPGGSQGTSGYPGGQGSSGLQGPSVPQASELGQQKPYPNIQSPSRPSSSYIPPISSDDSHGPQTSNRPQGAGTQQESRKPQGPNGDQGVNRPQDYSGHEGPRPGSGIQVSGGPIVPGDAGSRGTGEPSRIYLPGHGGPDVNHPVGPGFSGVPLTPDASGRPNVPGTHRDSNFPGVPGVPSTPSDSGTPGVPGGSFSGAPIGPFPGMGGAGIFYEGKYEEGDYSAIPGDPDIDYPIYSSIPETSFNCNQQQYPGYYADVEARCQVFHVCANNKTYDFLCPNGTIFHQEYLICAWWNHFDCNSAPSLYGINAHIYDYFISGQLPGAVPSSSGFPGQGSSSGYPGTQGPGIGDRPLQGPSGPQESVGPMESVGLQQRPIGSDKSEGPRGSAFDSKGPNSVPLEPQKPSAGFPGSGRPGTPSREYLPQVSR